MLRLQDILDAVRSYHPQADLDIIRKAYVFSARVHTGQTRKSGEPFLSHPLEVCQILTELKLDEASLCTGLLHDTVEDTLATHEDIEKLFGKDIAELVDGVTKLSTIQFHSSEEKQAENFRKMLVAMSKDIRVLLVKLADRLHNMRTLGYMKPDRQEAIAAETMEIYAPLANRLGIGWIKIELEDLSFKYLKAREYSELKEKIGKTKKEHARFIDDVSGEIAKRLSSGGIENALVSGRPKHLWSIYRKMKEKALHFEDIYDLIAFRVIVGSLGQCYEALGLIHSLWRPIPGLFKDYIAMPKPNGYQSLHTTLFGPKGERIEVQIRTQEMHEVAESGIAAHWAYKESKISASDGAAQGFVWLKQLMDWQRMLKDPNEFLDSVKVDLFAEEVYVFTPQGDVIELPRGATPVDFAFAIHSDVGMQCVGAKVNSRLVPLRYVLNNGDACEIITQKNQLPKKDWLEFVKTSRARTKIRALLRQIERQKSLEIGKEILDKEFRRYGINFQKYLKTTSVDDLLKNLKYHAIDEVAVALGYGKVEAKTIIEAMLPENLRQEPVEEAPKSRLRQLIDRLASRSSSGVKIEGIDNMLVHYARCCSPVKGDSIIGFITRGRGLIIHRANCPKVMEQDSERRINVSWDSQVQFVRPIAIRVVTDDREGMLTDLSSVFARMNMNISEAKCSAQPNGLAINIFKCGVADLAQLRRVAKALEAVRGVHSVERARSLE